MKNLIIAILIFISSSSSLRSQPPGATIIPCQQKIIPLRTFTDIPYDDCYYMKDTDNELQDFVGTWTGTWDNKTLIVNFKKVINKYDINRKYNRDLIIGKYKVVDNSGTILFDNTMDSDINAKIEGGKFAKIGAKAGPEIDIGGKYSMRYYDKTLCNLNGSIYLNFTDNNKTQIQWSFHRKKQMIFPDCYYYNYPKSQYPNPLPRNITLTKQ